VADDIISSEEARALVDSGDWSYEQHLVQGFERLLSDRVHELYEGRAFEDPEFGLQSRLSTLSRALRSLALETAEDEIKYAFPPASRQPPAGHQVLELRIGFGKIVKLTPTFKFGILPAASVICSFLLISNISLLMLILTAGATAPSIHQFIKDLLACYERLEDPKELAVFEVLAHTQAQLSLVDYDAHDSGDYDRAYAAIAPGVEDIAEAITIFPDRDLIPSDWHASPPEEWIDDLRSVLTELVSRKTLRKKGDLYSIVV